MGASVAAVSADRDEFETNVLRPLTRMIPPFLAPVPHGDPDAAAVEIENLTVLVGDRVLLQDANLRLERGEVVLLVGGSGTGKSILIRLLLGLLTPDSQNFRITGSVRIEGVDILGLGWNRAASRRIGMVFQDYALFDELTVEQNVDFAFDHAIKPWRAVERKRTAERLARTLDLPQGTPIARLSGGERRRVAIARTLAFNPDILLYDEPTTGLDPLNAARVAELIAGTNRTFQKTSLVVTHDFDHLRSACSRVIVLDPVEHSLTELAPDEATVPAVKALLSRAPSLRESKRRRTLLSRAALLAIGLAALLAGLVGLAFLLLGLFAPSTEAAVGYGAIALLGAGMLLRARVMDTPAHLLLGRHLVDTGRVVEHVLAFPLMVALWPLGLASTAVSAVLNVWRLPWLVLGVFGIGAAPVSIGLPLRLRVWPRGAWALRYFWHYLRMVGIGSALLYICAAGTIIGFVATFFTFRYFPYAAYTEELIRDDVMGAIAFLLFRVMIPLIATVLIAARCGAAVTADLGNRVYTSQADALRTLNVSPMQYWGTNVLWAFLIAGPILVAAAFTCATAASGVAYLMCKADQAVHVSPQEWWIYYASQIFHSPKFSTLEDLLPIDWHWVVIKTEVCMAAIAVIANGVGMSRKDSAVSVSRGITTTILWSTLVVLAIHVAFAFFEFVQPGAVN